MSYSQFAMKKTALFISLSFGYLLAGCNQDTVYKGYEDIPDSKWFIKNSPGFVVDIKDSVQTYDIYYLVRNSVKYPYYNLYLTRELKDPLGQVIYSRLSELYLSNEKTGKPFGQGLGDIFDHKIIIVKGYRFPRTGKYTFTLAQSMRQDPLPEIVSVGIAVEKSAVTH